MTNALTTALYVTRTMTVAMRVMSLFTATPMNVLKLRTMGVNINVLTLKNLSSVLATLAMN